MTRRPLLNARVSVIALLSAALLAAAPVIAQPAPTAKPAPTAAPAPTAKPGPNAKASAAPATSGSAAAMPPGHPPTDAMPPGHPPTGAMPPGHPPQQPRNPGFFRPRENVVLVSKELQPGVIDAMIVDADERPLAGAPVTLAILRNSVTKGESRDTRQATTNEQGRAVFKALPVGSGISYTINTSRGEAGFSSQPFGLKQKNGVKVLLHAYEAVTELAGSMMVMEAVLVMDIKEDSIAINHLIRGLNLGRTAFVAKNVSMRLPEGWKAYNKQDSASGVAMVEKDGSAYLEGTFPPGQSEMTFRYQLPLTGETSQTLKLPLPPRVAQTSVMVSAGKGMGLSVAGFPAAQTGRRRDGKRVLQTVKQVDPGGGIQQFLSNTAPGSIEVTISGIPTPGPARWYAVGLSILAMLGGGAYWNQSRKRDKRRLDPDERTDLVEARAALLGEMALLERARQSGDVGPRSYERLRTALLDALARILARLDADASFAASPALAGAGGALKNWPEEKSAEPSSGKRASSRGRKKRTKASADGATAADKPRKRRKKKRG